jgi:hypothetical protein
MEKHKTGKVLADFPRFFKFLTDYKKDSILRPADFKLPA